MSTKNFRSTPYDDAFHTLVQKTPELLIPLVNEMFQEDFQPGDEVQMQSDDLPSVDDRGDVHRRFTDSVFSIRGTVTKLFHIECESKSDGSIVIRMVEYGFHKALRDARYEEGELVIEMPNSAVLFLRHTRNTPERFQVKIATPGGNVQYPIEVLKIGRYTLGEIFEKKLLFLLPFHIFSYENDLADINDNGDRLEALMEVYEEIIQRIGELSACGELSASSERLILSMMRHVLDGVARNYEQVREVGNTMLGRVIDNDYIRMIDQMDVMEKEMAEKEAKLGETETKLGEAETRLGEAETRLGEAETRLGEAETRLGEAERLLDRAEAIRCASLYLSSKGRSEEIVRLYDDIAFLEEVRKESEKAE